MALNATERIIVGHGEAVRSVRQRVQRYAASRWGGLNAYYPADIDRFVSAVVPTVEAGQAQIWQLNNAYFDAIARVKGFKPHPAAAVVGYSELRSIDPDVVYARPGATTRFAISEGRPLEESAMLGLHRLGQLVAADMQIANVNAAFARTSGDDRLIGYQRTINSGNPCALCLIASTQRYYKEDLLPIHDSCSCGVEPLYGTEDRQVIDQERLDSIYAKLDEEGLDTSSDYNDLVSVQQHGELGPVLTWKGQNFKGPEDVAELM